PRRIAVIGVSGNGKTTLARRVAKELGVRYVELDALCHQPGWREAPNEEFRRDVLAAIDDLDAWVVDGSYDRKLGNLVYERADTVVWLDLPLPLVVARLVHRAIWDIVTQRDLFNGNRQTLRFAFLERDSLVAYAIKQHFRRRRLYPHKFAAMPHVELVRLRSPSAVRRWLAAQTRTDRASAGGSAEEAGARGGLLPSAEPTPR
ncbi:MAG: AAA family ATPase, partial [Labilithrix sp.]|nr:AAA family ATPase [Labilithrix sp.]